MFLDDAEYVSFGGCACKGLAYLGMLRALQERPEHQAWHARLRGACGSSSGCLAALAFLVDVDARAFVDRCAALDIDSVAPCMDLNGVLTRFGMDSGQVVRTLVRELFALSGLSHDDTTFATLHRLTGRDLRVCVTNLSTLQLQVFSHATTPDVVISSAMYWSMCIPFVFEPETFRDDVMVDGCALAVVPYDVFDLDRTLVFYVSAGRPLATDRCEINSLRTFAGQVLACCALEVYKRVDSVREARPDRFLHLRVGAEDDTVLRMDRAIVVRQAGLGYYACLARLRPELRSVGAALLAALLSVALRF